MGENLRKDMSTLFNKHDMYRKLVESLRVGIYVADAKGNLVYVNRGFVNILGYASKDEVIGLNLGDNLYVNPEERKELLKKMEKISFVRDYKVKNKRKDGSVVILSVTSNIIYGENSEIVGVEGVVYDITEHKELEDSKMTLQMVVEQTHDNVSITDKNGVIHYVNSAFEKTTGYLKEEIVGKSHRVLKSGKHDSEYYKNLWAKILDGKNICTITTNKKKNGELYIADQTISPIKDQSGEIIHFVSIWKDITEKVRLDECLRTEKQKLEEIVGFDEKVSAIRKSEKLMDFVVAKTMKILEAQKCSIMLFDKETDELCVKASVGFDDPPDSIKIKISDSVAEKVILTGEPLLIQDINVESPAHYYNRHSYVGRSFMIVPVKVDENVIAVINVANKCTQLNQDDVFNEVDLKILCAIAREVAVAFENINFYKELQYLTITDPLTNMHNFRHFVKSLDYEIKRIKRYSGNLGLMMMDIDDFKSYNDQFGHLAGDQLLKDIGRIIQNNLRDVDILCRYAGDEFVIILSGTDKAGSEILAQRIRIAIEKAEFKKPMTVSIGVSQYHKEMSRHEVTSKADGALYQAKKEGKNRVCVFA